MTGPFRCKLFASKPNEHCRHSALSSEAIKDVAFKFFKDFFSPINFGNVAVFQLKLPLPTPHRGASSNQSKSESTFIESSKLLSLLEVLGTN